MALADIILRYLQALVWPIAVLVIAVMFRRSIRAALGRLTEVTGPGVSAKFETEAESMAVQAREAAARQPAPIDAPYARPEPSPMPPYQPGLGAPYAWDSPYEQPSRYGPPSPDETQPACEPVTPPLSGEPGAHSADESASGEDREKEPAGDVPPPPPPVQQQPYAPAGLPPVGAQPSPARRSPDKVRSRVRTAFAVARATAESDPSAAVRAAWTEVARAVEELTSVPASESPERQMTRLAAVGVTPEVRDLLRRLDRMGGDAAVQPKAVTLAAARAYVTAAEEAVVALYRATGRTP